MNDVDDVDDVDDADDVDPISHTHFDLQSIEVKGEGIHIMWWMMWMTWIALPYSILIDDNRSEEGGDTFFHERCLGKPT